MRTATIGDDGILRDADGLAFSRIRPPMLGNVRRAPYLGQTLAPVTSVVPVDTPSPAYAVALKASVPASSFSYTRKQGNQDTQIYPGRLVISGAPEYQVASGGSVSGTVFRVSARASETEGNEFLLSLQGKNAGAYLSIPVSELCSEKFQVVTPDGLSAVEISMPDPVSIYLDDEVNPARISGYWSLKSIEYGIQAIASLPYALTLADFTASYSAIRSQLTAAFIYLWEGIKTAGVAYDASSIGYKGLCILTRVGLDAYDYANKLISIVEGTRADPADLDQAKVTEFWDVFNECTQRAPYWSALLARANIFQIYTKVYQALIAQMVLDNTSWAVGGAHDVIVNSPDEVMKALAGQVDITTGQPITPERAKELIALGQATLGTSLASMKADKALLDASDASYFGDAWKPETFPSVLMTLGTALDENAKLVLELKEGIKKTSPRTGLCLSIVPALGQIEPAIATSGGGGAATAAPAPGGGGRSVGADLVTKLANYMLKKMVPKNRGDLEGFKKSSRVLIAAAEKFSTVIAKLQENKNISEAPSLGDELARIKILREAARSKTGPLKGIALGKVDPFRQGESILVNSCIKEAFDRAQKRIVDYVRATEYTRAHRSAEQFAPKVTEGISELVKLWTEGFRGPTGALDAAGKPIEDRQTPGRAMSLKSIEGGAKEGKPGEVTLAFGNRDAKLFFDYFFSCYKEGLMSKGMVYELAMSYLEGELNIPRNKALSSALKSYEKDKKAAGTNTDALNKTEAEWAEFLDFLQEKPVEADDDQLNKSEGIAANERAKPPANREAAEPRDLAELKSAIFDANAKVRRRVTVTEDGKKAEKKGSGAPWTEDLYVVTESDFQKFARDLGSDVDSVYREALDAVRALESALNEAKETLKLSNVLEVKDETPQTLIEKDLAKGDIHSLIAKIKGAQKVAAEKMEALRPYLRGWSGLRVLYVAKNVWEKVSGKICEGVKSFHEGALKKNSTAFAYALFGLPQITATAIYLFLLIFVAVGVMPHALAKNILFIPAVCYGWVLGLLGYSPAGNDPGPSAPGGGRTRSNAVPPGNETMTPTMKLVLLGLGISLIFSGGKVFTAVDKVFTAMAKIIDDITRVVGAKKKGARGRPSGGGGGGGSGRGRGRPPSIDKAKDEVARAEEALDQAQASGDESRIKQAQARLDKAEAKLAKAEEKELFRGMIGNFWRLNNA